MAKEIGNWAKQAKPKPRKADPDSRPTTALELFASRVPAEEKILWASYGSGTRKDERFFFIVLMSTIASLILAQMLMAAAASTPLAAQMDSLVWALCALPVYMGYRTLYAPRHQAYAVTEQRVLILQRHIPFIMVECEILALMVSQPKENGKAGDILFGRHFERDSNMRPNPLEVWRSMTPEPGFYGIADPLAVARLISEHFAPDIIPDTYAATFDDPPIWR